MTDPYVKERDRTKIPARYQWNLADIYPSREAWKSAKEKLVLEFPEITKFRGKLAESPQSLRRCLETSSRLKKELTRLTSYASMTSDLDTRDSAALAMKQEMGQIGTDFAALAAYVDPEILAIGRHKIEAFLAEDSSLETFRHSLDDILRREAHTGSEGEEKIIADAGLMSDAPGSIYSVFSNADFPFPEVTLSTGLVVRLDEPAFSLHRGSPAREDRKKVFVAYLGKMHEFRRTFGAQLYAEVRKNMFFSRARRYGSALERALDANNIPVSVYTNLVEGVRQNLGTLHRYLGIRKKLQGLEELHYYDLYAPLVKQIDRDYRFEEASAHVLSALEPLGQDYTAVVREAFQNRWIDVYHNEGKRSGAYSDGAVYDVHPYILLNYNGKYGDVSTLAHELGHTMHSHLSNLAQPYHLSRYSIFIAEVASTFNEALLLDYMLKTVADDSERLSLLGNYLDGARSKIFRQAQLAEYEMRIHETAEKGEALTGDLLSSIYEQIAKDYYGHDAGICFVDDEIRAEWSYIHHFYYNFYVYQYATSFTASSALAERVLSGDSAARNAYLDLLRSGATDYPVNLLRKAGVDMTTQEPLRATLRKMNRVMEEVEEIASRLAQVP